MSGEFPPDRPACPAPLTVPASLAYRALARRYHARFDRARAGRASVPVISVGNIVVGGSGKTPTVIALGKLIAEIAPELAAPNAIAVLSRGYRRTRTDLVVVEAQMDDRECGDEPLLIKRALPNAAVVVHADRFFSAAHATQELGARLIILDDGFQHRRLARDLDLVLVDGESPLGNGWCLPAGPLREPAESLRRASVLVGVGETAVEAEKLAREMGLMWITARPKTVIPCELSTNPSTPVFLLTSIARPSRVYNILKNMRINVVGGRAFRDHHHFCHRDIRQVIHSAIHAGAQAIVTTAKDAIRLPEWTGELPLRVLDVTMEFSPAERIREVLEPILECGVNKINRF
ncbi:MAG: tetraacyldisaccharide 4'-kinase [bacterium]|nr:tetraacyldisaccharide 4'-kinase [bacterium]